MGRRILEERGDPLLPTHPAAYFCVYTPHARTLPTTTDSFIFNSVLKLHNGGKRDYRRSAFYRMKHTTKLMITFFLN